MELSLSVQVLDELASSVEQMDPDKVLVLSKRAVDAGIDPADIVENGIAKGLRRVGERFNYISRLLTEIEVNDETLAVDLIRRIGPAGNFMAEKHTRTHLERGEILHPKLFNRQAIADWKAKGQLSTREEARVKVKSILQDHKPPPLPSEVIQQIDQILKQASQTMTK